MTPARSGPGTRRFEVMGVGFDHLTEDQFATRMVDSLIAGGGGYAVTPNTDIVRKASRHPELLRWLGAADLSVADGMPIIWAARLAGSPLPERVAGSSSLYTVASAAASAGAAIFLLGGRPGAGPRAADRLRQLHPQLRVGHHCPPLGFEDDQRASAAVDRAVEEFGPAIYFCGFGCPKQERLIASLSLRYRASWFVGCGGSIDFAAGETTRAPSLLQRSGLEWVWRLAHEPRRLFRRYIVDDAPFAARMLAQGVILRRRRRAHPVPEIETATPAYLCFAAQDWWYHNQAHSDFQLMRRVAESRPVLVVNSLGLRMPTPGRSTQPWHRMARKAKSIARLVRAPLPELPNFHVMSPLALPLYGRPRLAAANAWLVAAQVRLACARLGIRRPVVIVTMPTAEPVLRHLDCRLVVANRSDKHSNFAEAEKDVIAELEARLIGRADHVLYSSHALMEDEQGLSGDKASFFDHGVDIEHFAHTEAPEPADLRAIPRPRVGFFGAVDDLVDIELLDALAERVPDAQLVVIGSATVPVGELARRANVHLLGFRPYSEIPAYGSGFDVALMPWKANEWIRLCNPIKLKEYLALGLPVVSTPFPELAYYPDVVHVAADPDAFVAAVQDALRESAEPTGRASRRDRIAGQTWAMRAQELMKLCEGPGR